MPQEDFIVRITRKGEVLVEIPQGLPPRRIKDLMQYFEETLGPVTIVEVGADGSAGGRVEIDDLMGREQEQEAEKNRLRLKEGD